MTDLEQRAFSPDEVATMLGVDRQVVSNLLEEGELGSKKIGGSHRIFLSDLEDYLGGERARSLVCEINSGERENNDNGSESDGSIGIDFEVLTDSNKRDQGTEGSRVSRYEPVARKWRELSEEEAIVLADLEKIDIQNIRNLLYRRFGKETVIVRSAEQEDGTFKALIRAREGDKYLRE